MSVPDSFGWVGHVIAEKYRVDEPVAEGGFAIVYRGHHLGFDEPIAIKCLRLPPTLDDATRAELLASLVEEGRLLRKLSRASPAIVQALDVGAAESPVGVWTPYLILDWLDGETLDRFIATEQKRGAWPGGLEAAVELLRPAAQALAVAHAQGVAHRDVKPSNLFVQREGDTTSIKVLDFGIAKLITDNAGVTKALRETGASITAFTPGYGAPEQFSRRFGATGPWTDVFALALVFIEVVTGRPALDGVDSAQLFAASADPTHRPGFAGSGVAVPAAVERLLARALAVDPAERPQSVGAFWEALESAVRRHGSLALAATLPATSYSDAELAALRAASTTTPSPVRTSEPPATSVTRGKRLGSLPPLAPAPQRSRVALAAFGLAIMLVAAGATVLLFPRSRSLPPPPPGASASASTESTLPAGSDVPREPWLPENEGVTECDKDLFVQLATPSADAPADYAYPLTRKAAADHAELAGARFVETTLAGRRVFGALVTDRAQADRLVEVAGASLSGKAQVLCMHVTPTREVFKLDEAGHLTE